MKTLNKNELNDKIATACIGDDYSEEDGLATAGISLIDHGNAIEVAARTLEEAQGLRDIVLAAISSPWISVEDRLPDNREVCLAYHPDWPVGISWLNDDGKDIDVGLSGDFATHWMPLPGRLNE